MANEVMIPSGSTVPAHILALLKSNPSLLSINDNAANGIGGASVPTIIAYMGTFKTKVDGVEAPIQIQTEQGPMNASRISAIILAAKKQLIRSFYMGAFVAGQEPQSPDCSSEDGIKPRSDSPNKQCESCAGCPQNVWGSAKQQDGSAGKGKACSERKVLAVYANKGVYKFTIPPASLGDFAAYAKQLGAHGLALPTVVTSISFDPAAPTKLVFTYVNVLDEKQLPVVIGMIDSPEVKAIIDDAFGGAPQAALPASPAEDPAIKAAAEKKAKDEAAAAEKKAAADKKAAEKKAKDDAAKLAAQSAGPDLGLDLGGASSGPSDDDLAALLDL